MSIKCLRIRIYGKVQGVWFRASTKRKADELGLTGFVKNEADGSVFVEVVGNEAPLGLFLEWCQEGPELAKVRNIKKEEIAYQEFQGFDVIR